MSDRRAEPELAAGDLIELRLPSTTASVPVVRLALSAIAEQVGLAYDDIVELKIAVSEACAAIIARDGAGILAVRARRAGDGLAVEVRGTITTVIPDAHDELRLALIRALVDDLAADFDPPYALVRFSRRSRA